MKGLPPYLVLKSLSYHELTRLIDIHLGFNSNITNIERLALMASVIKELKEGK